MATMHEWRGGQEVVVMPKEDYEEMKKEIAWLRCLEATGVDNWEGHDIAVDSFQEQYPEG